MYIILAKRPEEVQPVVVGPFFCDQAVAREAERLRVQWNLERVETHRLDRLSRVEETGR